MGKRSSFERVERDFYVTPPSAVIPLLAHLPARSKFIEPCAGDGALIRHLEAHGHKCIWASDIEPRAPEIHTHDALTLAVAAADFDACFYITNPPWDRAILHPLIERLSAIQPTWLLFDADWVHTRQAGPFMRLLRKIVSVGRVKWIEDSPFTGKDNCAWHLFDARSEAPAVFVGREAA